MGDSWAREPVVEDPSHPDPRESRLLATAPKRRVPETRDSIAEVLQRAGDVPLPPYMHREAAVEDRERYQTVFAPRPGAVAAPTAGLHFDPPMLDELVRAQQNKTLWRNFQGYTTHKDCDILAFGASSISQTADVYMQNEKSLKRYQDRVAATGFAVERGLKLTRDDQIQREAITRVMCDLELDFAEHPGLAWSRQ